MNAPPFARSLLDETLVRLTAAEPGVGAAAADERGGRGVAQRRQRGVHADHRPARVTDGERIADRVERPHPRVPLGRQPVAVGHRGTVA